MSINYLYAFVHHYLVSGNNGHAIELLHLFWLLYWSLSKDCIMFCLNHFTKEDNSLRGFCYLKGRDLWDIIKNIYSNNKGSGWLQYPFKNTKPRFICVIYHLMSYCFIISNAILFTRVWSRFYAEVLGVILHHSGLWLSNRCYTLA